MNAGNIYQNTNFKYNNGQESCICNKEIIKDKTNIKTKIQDIFKNNTFINRKKVLINNKTYTIIGKTNSKLITIDNKIINISDIKDIKEIN